MWIQILLIAGVIAIGAVASRTLSRDTHLALRRMALALGMAAAIVFILAPEWLSAIANLLGIGRGADLLLYAVVIAFIGYVAADMRRSARRQRQVTIVVRALAVAEARAEDRERPR